MELLTVKEVSGALRLSQRQVWKLAASGRLPKPVKLGRSARWRRDQIEEFISNGCRMQEPTGARG